MKKFNGFTLAEVLITLAVIGIVAVLVLPGFIQDMGERINSHRQANIAQKITKSVELMIVNGDYEGIYNTNQFVDKLSKYLKISKRCDSAHIADCWPTKKVKTSRGEEYNVADARTNKDLHTAGNQTDNVGLILADGATLIMTFNPNATNITAESGFIPTKKSLPTGGGKSEEFAYTSNATGAIDFVMDVNGKTGPNAEVDSDGNMFDIRSFKVASFTANKKSCEEYENSAYVSDPEINFSACVVSLGTNYKCISEEPYNNWNNCWAGARKACSDMGLSLPNKYVLQQLYYNRDQFDNKFSSVRHWGLENCSSILGQAMFTNGQLVCDGKSEDHKYFALCVDN